MTEEQIKHMVSRFLQWKLPADFSPDGGIRFEVTANATASREYQYERNPIGTNLFTAIQAEAMVRHMLDGLDVAPGATAEATVVGLRMALEPQEVRNARVLGTLVNWLAVHPGQPISMQDASILLRDLQHDH